MDYRCTSCHGTVAAENWNACYGMCTYCAGYIVDTDTVGTTAMRCGPTPYRTEAQQLNWERIWSTQNKRPYPWAHTVSEYRKLIAKNLGSNVPNNERTIVRPNKAVEQPS